MGRHSSRGRGVRSGWSAGEVARSAVSAEPVGRSRFRCGRCVGWRGGRITTGGGGRRRSPCQRGTSLDESGVVPVGSGYGGTAVVVRAGRTPVADGCPAGRSHGPVLSGRRRLGMLGGWVRKWGFQNRRWRTRQLRRSRSTPRICWLSTDVERTDAVSCPELDRGAEASGVRSKRVSSAAWTDLRGEGGEQRSDPGDGGSGVAGLLGTTALDVAGIVPAGPGRSSSAKGLSRTARAGQVRRSLGFTVSLLEMRENAGLRGAAAAITA